MKRPALPASLSISLLAAALGACDADEGRTGGPGAACATAKCDDPNANDPQQANEDPTQLCTDGLTTEQRIDACYAMFPDSPLWTKPRPSTSEPHDLLYYVNRWHSIDPCFLDGATSLPAGGSLSLAQRDFRHIADTVPEDLLALERIESYGLRLATEPTDADWTSCTDKQLMSFDLVRTSGSPNVLVRADAWESPLPAGWANPEDGWEVDGVRIQGFRALFLAAEREGIALTADSGYRSAHTQAGLFDGYANGYGLDEAETFSAHPLHSEHQLGTAIDMLIGGFGDPKDDYATRLRYAESNQLDWVRDNAHRFGVVLSYPVDRVTAHQYVPEPWHFRYVGVEAATVMHECHLSTEELMQAMYGDELPELPEFAGMDLVSNNIDDVGYTQASCWYPVADPVSPG